MRTYFHLNCVLTLGLLFGCGQSPSIVRDSVNEEEELQLQRIQQSVEVEEREHQQKILARNTGGG